MFGDNEAVVTSGTIPHSKLSKRWHMLPYHRVRGAVAAGQDTFGITTLMGSSIPPTSFQNTGHCQQYGLIAYRRFSSGLHGDTAKLKELTDVLDEDYDSSYLLPWRLASNRGEYYMV